eukprot:GHVT01081869.1.p1 GENE.GHVT01081869.1~~GHVT01081869.1.p1  ORF type:complete len:137 (+),score=16.76 GHVT01081869.1:129-539(+)
MFKCGVCILEHFLGHGLSVPVVNSVGVPLQRRLSVGGLELLQTRMPRTVQAQACQTTFGRLVHLAPIQLGTQETRPAGSFYTSNKNRQAIKIAIGEAWAAAERSTEVSPPAARPSRDSSNRTTLRCVAGVSRGVGR